MRCVLGAALFAVMLCGCAGEGSAPAGGGQAGGWPFDQASGADASGASPSSLGVVFAPLAGSRLKPMVVRGADGSEGWLLNSWWDTQLEIRCSMMWEGCLPQYSGIRYFADPSCTTPVVQASPRPPIGPQDQRDYVRVPIAPEGVSKVYELGSPWTSALYQAHPFTLECTEKPPLPPELSSQYEYREVVREVPLSDFVSTSYHIK